MSEGVGDLAVTGAALFLFECDPVRPRLTDLYDAGIQATPGSLLDPGYYDLQVVSAEVRPHGIRMKWTVTSGYCRNRLVDTGLLQPRTSSGQISPLFQFTVCALGLADMLEQTTLEELAAAMPGRSLRALVMQHEYRGNWRNRLATVEAVHV